MAPRRTSRTATSRTESVPAEAVPAADDPPAGHARAAAPALEGFAVEATAALPLDRLDRAVVAVLAARGVVTSRAAVQRWIQHGRVLVAGRAVTDPAARLRVGVELCVQPEQPPPTAVEPDASVRLRVVHDDADLVVIDKPAGLVVHPARGHATGTLVHGLLALGGFERAADDRDPAGHLRPGIVHRLDKGTSGLLVVARREPIREALKALFAAHDIEREYVAIVVGRARDATLDTPHGRHPQDRLRFTSRGRIAVARRAITHVRVLAELDGATLVACRLETGRTHQIRVHLAEQLGTPVLGDPLYGPAPRDPALRTLAAALGHQALHARLLGFVHPGTRRAVHFTSPLPDDVVAALRALGGDAPDA